MEIRQAPLPATMRVLARFRPGLKLGGIANAIAPILGVGVFVLEEVRDGRSSEGTTSRGECPLPGKQPVPAAPFGSPRAGRSGPGPFPRGAAGNRAAHRRWFLLRLRPGQR